MKWSYLKLMLSTFCKQNIQLRKSILKHYKKIWICTISNSRIPQDFRVKGIFQIC